MVFTSFDSRALTRQVYPCSGIALQLLTQYLSAGSVKSREEEFLLWQEDGRVALVEKPYYYLAEMR